MKKLMILACIVVTTINVFGKNNKKLYVNYATDFYNSIIFGASFSTMLENEDHISFGIEYFRHEVLFKNTNDKLPISLLINEVSYEKDIYISNNYRFFTTIEAGYNSIFQIINEKTKNYISIYYNNSPKKHLAGLCAFVNLKYFITKNFIIQIKSGVNSTFRSMYNTNHILPNVRFGLTFRF